MLPGKGNGMYRPYRVVGEALVHGTLHPDFGESRKPRENVEIGRVLIFFRKNYVSKPEWLLGSGVNAWLNSRTWT